MNITLNSVSKSYGKIHALANVSLTVEPGQIVAVLGPNGAGKTTLLRLLGALVSPNKGEVLYDGELFYRGRLDLRRRLCFLPDFPMFLSDVSVVRHLGMMLRLYERPRDKAMQRVTEVLEELDLLPLADTLIGRLSRGQLYKTALAGLLVVAPELWLLDEPFASGMDPQGIALFKREALAARSNGHTVIYSTQILEIAERFADRVCVLHRGRLHLYGSIAELAEGAVQEGGVLQEIFRALREGGL